MSLSKELRDVVLGNAKKNFKTVEFEYEGQKFYVRQRTVAEDREIEENSKDRNGEQDNTQFLINMIITMTRDSEGNKVFSKADTNAFMQLSADDPFIKAFTKALISMGDVEGDVGKELEQDS